MPSNIEILKIRKFRPKVGPLTPYKPPFNPINRPWDPSRSIELEKIFMIELSRTSQSLSDARSCQNKLNIKYFLGLAWPGLAHMGPMGPRKKKQKKYKNKKAKIPSCALHLESLFLVLVRYASLEKC